MAKNQKQKKKPAAEAAPPRPKEFLDLIAPAAVKFNTDHYILGGTYRTVMALRTYPPITEELALLRRLGEMEGVTLHLSTREVTAAEENAILHAAANKTRMERSNLNNMKQSVTAEAKLQDTEELIRGLRRNQVQPHQGNCLRLDPAGAGGFCGGHESAGELSGLCGTPSRCRAPGGARPLGTGR